MKPRLKPDEVSWFQAYERIKALPVGSKLKAGGVTYKLVHVWGDPHPPRVELSYRAGRKTHPLQVRRGHPLLLELQ